MSRAVLWDLDGTLVDSSDHHWRAWHQILQGEGLSLDYDQFLASFGQKNDRILRGWLGEETPAERIQTIGDAKEAEYRRLAERGGLVPLPGASEWVARLHQDGWKQAVASSAPRLNVELVMQVLHLASYFDTLVAAEDVTTGKPSPEVFRAAAFRLHVSPSRCIVVEDAAAGIEAARRAGMKCVGVGATMLEADVDVRSLVDLEPGVFDSLVPKT